MNRSPLRIAAAAGVLVLSAAALYPIVIRRTITGIGLRTGTVATSRVMARFTPEYVKPQAAREALAILEPLGNGSHDDQRVAMLRGSNLLVLQQAEAAELSYRQALSWGQRPEIYVALAEAQAAAGNRDAALVSISKALAFDAYMVSRSNLADLRAEALQRFEAKATPAERAEVYLNMGIGYMSDGYPNQAVEMVAIAATHDSRILTRPELLAWSDLAWVAIRRYAQIQRERGLQ